MSKFTLASRPATISMLMSRASGSTMGRLDRSCGAIGTSTQPAMPGCRIGPPADSAYAVGPAGGQRMRGGAGGRADDETVGAQVGDEVGPDVDLQLHHAGGGAAAHDDV